jgi:hypothetical protein
MIGFEISWTECEANSPPPHNKSLNQKGRLSGFGSPNIETGRIAEHRDQKGRRDQGHEWEPTIGTWVTLQLAKIGYVLGSKRVANPFVH